MAFRFGFLLLFLTLFSATTMAAQIPAFPDIQSPQFETLPSGMKIWHVERGTGAKVLPGKRAKVNYAGWLTNGSLFDNSFEGRPFQFKVGAGEVIEGWDLALTELNIGGKCYIILPPSLGYGNQAIPGAIPANSTLVFYIEVLGTN
jgi:FKBP-type peptidyl-prolyl cis-trans isomerase